MFVDVLSEEICEEKPFVQCFYQFRSNYLAMCHRTTEIGVVVGENNDQAASKPLPSLVLIPDLSNKSAVKSKNGPVTLPLGSGICNVSPAYF